MKDEYIESLAYLYGRLNYERTSMPRAAGELRLGRMRQLLRALGDPHTGLRIVHVAGTKGKGSTAAMIASALSAAGARAGLFCSPHLHRLEERFTLDGLHASESELVQLVRAIRPIAARLDAASPRLTNRPLTFFEITTAMGLLHFARRQADVVVLEVGLGGRLDSTNAIRPVVSVITSISLDHTRQLGSTLASIATEKAGILKRRGLAVSSVRGAEACEAIERVARRRQSRLRTIDTDFDYLYEPPAEPCSAPSAGSVRVTTWRRTWDDLRLPMLGAHQATNAAAALATLDALSEAEPSLAVDAASVARGWSALAFPARIEVLGAKPWIVIDGAHNVASALALAETLRTHFPRCRRTLIFGTTRDKDLNGQLRALLPLFDRVVATRYVENPRALAPEVVAQAVAELSDAPLAITPDPASALDEARRATPTDGLICVTGSLFLAAEARAWVLGIKPIMPSSILA